jgi:hypothetical protein
MDNEPTIRVDKGGTKTWRLNGKLHREDGPAAETAMGTKHWYLHGQHHRVDGPAVVFEDGEKTWFLNSNYYTFDEWLEANIFISEEEKVMLKLQYG